MKQQYDSYKPSGIDWIGDIPNKLIRSRVIILYLEGMAEEGFILISTAMETMF